MVITQKKDLTVYAAFFKSAGINGATREDLRKHFGISIIESRIAIKHLMLRKVVHPIGKKVVSKNAMISIYQFKSFDFVPNKKPIVTVRDALEVLGHDEDYEAFIEPMPTFWPAGSPEKIEVMRRRADKGEKIFSDLDCSDIVPQLTVLF